jgi:MFS-type transporter involved in bile tolerance (Atg22 family)
MARPSLAERLSAMDQPDHATEAGAMWGSVRPLLVLGRILMVGMLIIVGEIFDDVRVVGLTIGVWALVLGIPLFLLISSFITYVDRLVGLEGKEDAKR